MYVTYGSFICYKRLFFFVVRDDGERKKEKGRCDGRSSQSNTRACKRPSKVTEVEANEMCGGKQYNEFEKMRGEGKSDFLKFKEGDGGC